MTSTSIISETERRLLKYLGQSLQLSDSAFTPDLSAEEWERIYALADRHEVSVLLGTILEPQRLPETIENDFQHKTARTVHKGILLQSLSSRVTALLEKEGIKPVTLKGYAISRFYPVPEFRKTTDVDLFLCGDKDFKDAERVLCENGFRFSKEQHANHHSVLISGKSEKVELHVSWADDFKDKRLNKYLEVLQKESMAHLKPIDCDEGFIYVYDTAYQAFYLIIHMFQHFVGGGFGLRNLCDWVVLWENCDDENARKDFINIIQNSGIEKFSKAVTSVCVEYLGLSLEKSPFPYDALTEKELTDEFLRDVLDAGEFGYSESERMVGMDGNSLAAYVKEFHHQMHINFPKAGGIVPFWPVLWIATLLRFLNNNRKYNRAPVSAIMKKAGNRGKLVKKITSKIKDG